MSHAYVIELQQVAVKIETVSGTGETLSYLDVVVPIYNASFEPLFQANASDIHRRVYTNPQGSLGIQGGIIRFSLEVMPVTVSSSLKNYDAVFAGCGFDALYDSRIPSYSYRTISEDIKTVTVEALISGSSGIGSSEKKIRRIVGAQGTLKYRANLGQSPMLEFEFRGRYEPQSEGSFFTQPNLPGPEAVACVNDQYSIFSVSSLGLDSFELDLGNQIIFREGMAAARGIKRALIVDRKSTLSVEYQQTRNATHDLASKFETYDPVLVLYDKRSSRINSVECAVYGAVPTSWREVDQRGIQKIRVDFRVDGCMGIAADSLGRSIVFSWQSVPIP